MGHFRQFKLALGAVLVSLLNVNLSFAQAWHVFDSSNSPINTSSWAVAVDSDGNKWFGLADGQGLAVLTDTGWISVTLPLGTSSFSIVQSIAVDEQNVKWIGTSGGLYRLKDTAWTYYTPANSGLCNHSINDIEIAPNGVKWFATDYGVCAFNDTVWSSYNTLNSGIAGNSVVNVRFDTKGNAWFATDEGISTFNGNDWYTYDTSNLNIPINLISTLSIDRNNNVWFALGDLYGVYRLNDSSLINYNSMNSGIYDDDIWSIFEDAKGAIWFGTHQSISFYYKNVWTVYKAELTSKCYNVHDIVEDVKNNSLWFASESGAASLDLPAGVQNLERKIDVEIYPLPASDKLFVKVANIKISDASISTYDLQGNLIEKMVNGNGNEFELDVTDYPAGFYLIKLSDGVMTFFSRMLVVEH